ncbi:uncharacterized protein PHALS_05278 [Plasmopara halstedii]|uniref:Uncharacterized protein n=1 Tax=Plasmopara halstedii TaxID=4781 RepID=A0A0N7L7T3_PLAHL|nr:uncharacterized protein PHALS_05278 [Plasmopara halstedii]CEG47955.1 hypothetical protein PHALS_05278 [Plasmopara halstedii]|eukprot:XP_024584324.1 hypothetical protein PHALS_05278 [Plasmopara halstedii]
MVISANSNPLLMARSQNPLDVPSGRQSKPHGLLDFVDHEGVTQSPAEWPKAVTAHLNGFFGYLNESTGVP